MIGFGFRRNPIRIGYFLTGRLRFRWGTGVIASKWLFVLHNDRRETTSAASEKTRKRESHRCSGASTGITDQDKPNQTGSIVG